MMPAVKSATPTVPTPNQPSGSRDPIAVIRPYMVDLDPKVRANAASALAVVSTDYPAAAGALVDMWIAEKDASIVDQIERDLATLDGAPRAAVDGRLTTFEHDSLAERRDAARYCRGRLRLRGIGEGNPESLDALIALTAENAHRPEDMERALAALAELKGDEMFRAAGALRARLHSQHEWTRDQTYALLGRLRSTGSPLGYYRTIQAGVSPQAPPGAGGFHALVRDVRRRLSTAGSLARDAAAREARRFSAGFLWTVTAWAAAGASLVSIHLAATLEAQPAATFYTVYVVAVLVSSVALAASAVRRLSPIWLHYDRAAAAVQQAFSAAAWVLGPALVGVGILLASISFSNRLTNWIVALVAAPLSISAFVAIIRLGTILGFGLVGGERQLPGVTAFRRLWYSRRVRGVLETLVGASCGVLTTAVLLWLARLLHPHADIDEVSRLIEGMWLFLTPTSAAIASAFSLVDHFPITRAAADPRQAARASDANRAAAVHNPAELYRSFRTTITPRRVLAVALLVPLGMALALVIDDVRTWKPRIDMAPPGQTVPALQSITDLPTRRDFRVAFPQRVVATIPEQLGESPSAGSRPDLSLTLIEWTPGPGDGGREPDCRRRTNRRVVGEEDRPTIDRYLGWGCYSLEAGSPDRTSGIGRFSSVGLVLDVRALQAAGHSLGTAAPDRERMEGQYTLKLELNVSKEPSTKNADFGDGSTIHLLEQVPTEQKLVVRNPAAVLVSASPQILRAPESRRDKPIAEAPNEPAEVDNSEPSSPSADQPLRLELFKGTELIDQGRPDEPTIERVLSPGEYVVRVGGPPTRAKGGSRMEHPVALNVLSVRRPDSIATEPRNKPALEWRIPARLPALYEFDVPARQTVAVEIPAVFDWAPFNPVPTVRIRYVLELRRVKGQAGAAQSGFDSEVVDRATVLGDRDQIIQRVLDPGRYRCIVSAPPANTAAQVRQLSPTSAPKVTVSFLGETPADPPSTGAVKK